MLGKDSSAALIIGIDIVRLASTSFLIDDLELFLPAPRRSLIFIVRNPGIRFSDSVRRCPGGGVDPRIFLHWSGPVT